MENPHIEGGGWLCAILETHEVASTGHINQSEGGARPQHIARRHNDFKIDETTASKIDIPRNLQGIKGAVQIHPQGRTGIDGEVIQPVQEITARCTGGGASQMQDSAVIEIDGVRATSKVGCTIHDESPTVIDIHGITAISQAETACCRATVHIDGGRSVAIKKYQIGSGCHRAAIEIDGGIASRISKMNGIVIRSDVSRVGDSRCAAFQTDGVTQAAHTGSHIDGATVDDGVRTRARGNC